MAGKKDIAKAISNSTDLTDEHALVGVKETLNTIAACLKDGERVQLPGFGSFEITHRNARMGRNPATGQPIQIAASKGIKFKPSKVLKDAVNS